MGLIPCLTNCFTKRMQKPALVECTNVKLINHSSDRRLQSTLGSRDSINRKFQPKLGKERDQLQVGRGLG